MPRFPRVFLLAGMLYTTVGGLSAATTPRPEGWHRTDSFEAVLRAYQNCHIITKGEPFEFATCPNKPLPGDFPEDGYYDAILMESGLSAANASPLPSMINAIYAGLFEDVGGNYWTKTISHRFVTAAAFDGLMAGEVSPGSVYQQTVGQSIAPPPGGYAAVKFTLSAETKIDMVAERLNKLRYFLKPLPAAEVLEQYSGPATSSSYRSTPQEAADLALARWENATPVPVGGHPSRQRLTFTSTESLIFSRSLGKYKSEARSFQVRHAVDLTGVAGVAYAFRFVEIPPGTANPFPDAAEIQALAPRFDGIPPDGKYHHFATASAGGLVTFPWVGTGTPFSGHLEPRTISFRVSTDGAHREDYPDAHTPYGPFVIVDLGASSLHRLTDPDTCEICTSGTCTIGAAEFANNSIDASFSLGSIDHGKITGELVLKAPKPLPSIYDPRMLEIHGGDAFGAVYDSQSGELRQFYGPDTIVEITGVSPLGYTLQFYKRDGGWNPAGPSGLFEHAGSPPAVTSVVFANTDPEGTTYSGLKITTTTGSHQTETRYSYHPGSATWKMSTDNGERLDTLVTDVEAGVRTRSRTITDIDGSVIAQTSTSTQLFGWGSEPVGTSAGSGPTAPRMSYSYYANPATDGAAYGKLCQVSRSDGAWTRYHYEPLLGRLCVEIHGFGDLPAPDPTAVNDPDDNTDSIDESRCHVIRHIHPWTDAAAAPDTVTTIETLQGVEIARRYTTRRWGTTSVQTCLTPGAPFDPQTNPTTTTSVYLEPPYAGLTERISRPDGTVSLFSYADDASGNRTTAVRHGVPDPDGTGIIEGTITETTVTPLGHTVRTRVTDAASSLVIQDDQADPDAFDSFGRPTLFTHLGGLQSETVYDCCGVSSRTDRFGATTGYATDVPLTLTDPETGKPKLLLAETVTSPAEDGTVTIATARDGPLEYTVRIGTDGSTIVRSVTETDPAGRVVRRILPVGNSNAFAETTITEAADPSGRRVVTTTTPDGATKIQTYYLDGRLKSVTGTAVHPYRLEYGATSPGQQFTRQIFLDRSLEDTPEWVCTTIGMRGQKLKVERSSEFAPDGISRLSFTYDSLGRLAAETDADGVTQLYAYSPLGRQDTLALDRNANGKIDFQGPDKITRTTREVLRIDPDDPGSSTVTRTSTLVWATPGSQDPETVSLQDVAVTGLDTWTENRGQRSHRNLSWEGTTWIETTLRPDGAYLRRSFVPGSGLTLVSSESRFDAAHNRISSVSDHYDPHARPSTSTDTRDGGITKTFTYYDSDQIKTAAEPAPGTTDHGPRTTTYLYDDLGRLDLVTLPDAGVVDYDHTPTGQLHQISGARTYHLKYAYDHRGRLSSLKTRPGTPVEATTQWTYHPLSGRLAAKRAPGADPATGANTTAYTYTAAGRLRSKTNGRGTTATHNYSPSGELAGLTYDDGITPGASYTYQRLGHLATRSDASGLHTYAQNSLGVDTGSTVAGGVLDQTSTATSYDTLNRKVAFSASAGAETLSFHYGYDDASRLAAVTHGLDTVTYTRHPGSALIAATDFAHGGTLVLRESKTPDHLGRLKSVVATIQSPTPTVASGFTDTYNTANKRVKTDRHDGTSWGYRYDAFGHLTDATKYRTTTQTQPFDGLAFDYSYDAIGNRKLASNSGLGQPGPGQTTSHPITYLPARGDNTQLAEVATPPHFSVAGTADAAATVQVAVDASPPTHASRQGDDFHLVATAENTAGAALAQVSVTATLDGLADTQTTTHLVPAASAQRTYDADGNLVSDGYRTFTWDAENRLTKVQTTAASVPPGALQYRVEFVYDALGRRVQKTESHRLADNWVTASSQRFLYDGWNLVAEIEGTSSTPRITRSYTWGIDRSGSGQGAGGIGGLLVVNIHSGPAAGSHAATYDGNGNLTTLVGLATGAVTATYEYDPFGNLLRASGRAAKANPFRFSTKVHDDTTGLVYYGHRYYEPTTGRWLSRDPIAEDGGPNLYGFVGNDPVNATDILGLVLFAFDGTGNDRQQDSWDASNEGEGTPTNIAIMTDLYDGKAYYIHGVGTRTDIALGMMNGNGTKERLITQLKRFCIHKREHPDEPIDIIGFSRGAASARIFSNMLRRATPNPNIRFLGIFDTVSQMGLPNRLNFQFGYSLDVSSKIGLISHAVAQNEYRSLFPLTSVSKSAYPQNTAVNLGLGQLGVNAFDPEEFREVRGSNFVEKPFVGAHSDIGGGYWDGRNINALRWMISQGQSVGAPFANLDEYKFASEIQQISKPHDSRYFIDALQGDRVIFPGNL